MNWIDRLFRRRRMNEDLSAEIREHLEEKVEELVEGGMSREEAVFAAQREFGGVTQITERSREMWQWPSLESVLSDFRYGLRMLRKHPAFTAVAVITLALGIGANTAIFSVINTVLLRPLPYPQADRLVYLSEWSQQVPDMSIAMANFADWQSMNKVFDSMVAYRGDDLTMTGQGEPQRLAIREATAGLFPTLGIKPILGRIFTPADDKPGAEPVVLLSDTLWARDFGRDPGVLGRRLLLDGQPYTVIGVLPSSHFHPSWRRYDAFTSLGQLEKMLGGPAQRGSHPGIYAYGRMKPGVTVEQARADMIAIAAQLGKQYHKTNAGSSVVVQPLLDAVVEDIRAPLWVLMAAVGFVLLIACANVANLLTSRATERRREIAVRSALGAGASRLARQFLCESILLALIGGALGLVVAYCTASALGHMAAASVPRIEDVSIDRWVLGFTLAVSLLTGVVFGVFPALAAYRSDPNEALKESGRATSGGVTHIRFRNFLVAAELAISLALLVGAGLTIKSLLRIAQADPGYQTSGVLSAAFSLPDSKYKTGAQQRLFVQQLVEKVSALPGVTAAGFKNPLLGGMQTSFVVQGRPVPDPGHMPSTDVSRVTPGAMEAMGLKLLRGRFFTATDNQSGMKVCIVDDTMAEKNWPGEDPIGKQMLVNLGPEPRMDAIPWMTVVGVVHRVKNYGVDQPARLESFLPNAQMPGSGGNLVIRSQQDPEMLVPAVRQAMHSLDPDLALYNVRTLRDVTDENVAPRKLSVLLLSIFAGIALILAALGIYGVMSYVVTGRTHEIGLRMALGAKRADVLRLVLSQGMRVALVGVAAGVIVSLVLTRLMMALLFGVSATDPLTFAGVAALLMVVALLACYIPARAAMGLDPVAALRYE